jgi:hypothetical protein
VKVGVPVWMVRPEDRIGIDANSSLKYIKWTWRSVYRKLYHNEKIQNTKIKWKNRDGSNIFVDCYLVGDSCW